MTWFKGNLHMHSLWSDGVDFPETIAAWFKDHGYNFIAFTEHDRHQVGECWVSDDPAESKRSSRLAQWDGITCYRSQWGRRAQLRAKGHYTEARLKTMDQCRALLEEPGQFLIISGEEISVSWSAGRHWINAFNLPEPVPPQVSAGTSAEAIAQTVQAVNVRAGGRQVLASLDHPNFDWNARAEDIAEADDLQFMEIHTALNSAHSYGDPPRVGVERIWDVVLARRLSRNGKLLYGLATDDCHRYHEDTFGPDALPGRAWVMVRSDVLEPNAVIAAMTRGDFYASTGVALSNLQITERGIDLAVAPEDGVDYTIEFIGTRRGFDPQSRLVLDENGQEMHTTGRHSDDIGQVLQRTRGQEASYHFTGDELYVRAIVISDRPHPNPTVPGDVTKAWTQPVSAARRTF